MAKIRIATKQGQTFDAEWPDENFNFDALTANIRALQCIALPGLFIPYAEIQYIVLLNLGEVPVNIAGMTKQ